MSNSCLQHLMDSRAKYEDGTSMWYRPPRWRSVFLAMRAEGLLDRWCYRKYLEPILARYRATEKTTCWDVAWLENLTSLKDGTLRELLEDLGRPYDPDLAVMAFGGSARLSDVRATLLEQELTFGANGLVVEEFPVPGHRNYALMTVTDWGLVLANRHGSTTTVDRNGKEYWYSWELHIDRKVGQDIVPVAELQAKLARGPVPELAGRQLNSSAELAMVEGDLRAAQEKLLEARVAEIRGKLATAQVK